MDAGGTEVRSGGHQGAGEGVGASGSQQADTAARPGRGDSGAQGSGGVSGAGVGQVLDKGGDLSSTDPSIWTLATSAPF